MQCTFLMHTYFLLGSDSINRLISLIAGWNPDVSELLDLKIGWVNNNNNKHSQIQYFSVLQCSCISVCSHVLWLIPHEMLWSKKFTSFSLDLKSSNIKVQCNNTCW